MYVHYGFSSDDEPSKGVETLALIKRKIQNDKSLCTGPLIHSQDQISTWHSI